MGTLTIRKLDDKVIERLKARARTRRRSLEAELRELLSQASRQPLILDAAGRGRPHRRHDAARRAADRRASCCCAREASR